MRGRKVPPFCRFKSHQLLAQDRILGNISFGGQTELFSVYEKINLPCKGLAYDLIFLYLSIIVFGEFPEGHPEIVLHSFTEASTYFGVMRCRVLPPDNLFFPTLTLRLKDGRAVYSSCRSCSEEVKIAKPCDHFEGERFFEVAWVTSLLNQAIEDGYRVLENFEVHHFPRRSAYNPATKSGGIFAEFILALIRKKILISGFPSHIAKAEEKTAYCKEYEDPLVWFPHQKKYRITREQDTLQKLPQTQHWAG